MSLTTNHVAAGLPAWATEDEAREAAEAVLGTSLDAPEVQEEEAAKKAAQIRRDWAMAARFYWASAYQALTERNFRMMRENARIAQEADDRASPHGALLAAVFGGAEQRAPERPVSVGAKMPPDQVAAAKKAVMAEIDRHAAARQAAKKAKPIPNSASENWHKALAAVKAGCNTYSAIKAAHGQRVAVAAQTMARTGHIIEIGGRLTV